MNKMILLIGIFIICIAAIANVFMALIAVRYILKEKHVSAGNGVLLFTFVVDLLICAYVISDFATLHLF